MLPTYNEAENIDRFVRAVLPQLAAVAAEFHVLIVDDNSPDGTGTVADALAEEFDAVEVLHRPGKQGLSRAYQDPPRLRSRRASPQSVTPPPFT